LAWQWSAPGHTWGRCLPPRRRPPSLLSAQVPRLAACPGHRMRRLSSHSGDAARRAGEDGAAQLSDFGLAAAAAELAAELADARSALAGGKPSGGFHKRRAVRARRPAARARGPGPPAGDPAGGRPRACEARRGWRAAPPAWTIAESEVKQAVGETRTASGGHTGVQGAQLRT